MSNNSSTDVRMRGFKQRSTVEQALAWLESELDSRSATLPDELVDLSSAAGRVLASDVVAEAAVPSFRRAMMDGLAVRAADVQGAGSYNPISLEEVGSSMPGRAFEGTLESGQAVRIMTGAPMPDGADAVLPAEQVEFQTSPISAVGEVAVGKHVGIPGEDIDIGETIFTAGRKLRPQDLGLLSSIGHTNVSVVRVPRVRIVITGDELLPAGTKPRGHQITDANGPMLAALVARDGGEANHPGIVPDNRDALRAAMNDTADILLVSGGSSVGQEDHAPVLVSELGTLSIHGIAMRPASPSGMGTIHGNGGKRLVFLLPGNPVSCLCAYDFFAGMAIRTLAGRSREMPYRTRRLPLARKLVSVVGRVDYARVEVVDNRVEPLAISGASLLSSATRATGFVVIPDNSEGYPPGIEVDVHLYDV